MSNKVVEPTLDDLDAELCKRSFYYFMQMFIHLVIPEKIVLNWHMEYLCDELQEAAQRVFDREAKIEDIVINVPPGTSKSTIVTQMFPVWCWVKDSTTRIMTASYSASLSTDHSVKSRDVIKSDLFNRLFPDIQIKKDMDNKNHYKNTKGGERYATSVGGTIMGFHGHILIVDDPVNPKGAHSDADRETANSFMDQTLSTRKVDKEVTLTVLVMQRLHVKDPTGNWLKKTTKKIKHICIPGRLSGNVNPPELAEKYVDGLMDPKRLSNKALQGLKTDLGSYGFAGQIMQTPTPDGGGIWQKWIQPISDEKLDAMIHNGELTRYGTDWDLAYTEKESNSASAFCTAGVSKKKMYIDRIGFKWLEFPELISYMKLQSFPHHIEAKASGKSAKQVLTKNGIPAIEVKMVGGDKPARTRMATPYAEAGLVYCRESLLDELYNHESQGILVFPNGEHDDLNDCVCQSISRLLGNPSFFVI